MRVVETKRLSDSSGDVIEAVVSDYDHFERLVRQTNPDNKVVQSRFNAAGDRLAEIDPDGITTSNEYDALGRLRRVMSGGITTYDYYPDGLQQRITLPNGVETTMTYDGADRPTEIRHEAGGQPIARQTYGYDANGNRLTATEQQGAAAAETVTYTYDVLNRLASVAYSSGGSTAYTFDATGNRLTEIGTSADGAALNRTFAYDGLAQLATIANTATPAASQTFSYDRNGNTVRRLTGLLENGTIAAPSATQLFAFDIRDRLARADMLGGTGAVSFDYDASGRRTRMFSSLFDIRYAYGQSDVIQEYSGGSGIATQRYTIGNGLLAVGTPQDGNTLDNSFYLTDALRSATNLVNDSGSVVQTTKYDPWGNVRQRTGTSANRRAFTGHYEDAETGLLYMGARYYDPSTGRFLSRDSAAPSETDPISASKYLYAHANPLSYVDPTGNSAEGVTNYLNAAQQEQAAQQPVAEEPDLSQAGGLELFGHWAVGAGKGALKAIGAPIAGLLRSAVLGLADIAQAGLGYLAIEATGGKYVDEIGALLTPVSDIGKKSAEVGTLSAIGESATGMVKDTATSIVTMPSRMAAAANSGDPEQFGAIAVEVVQMGQSLKGPIASIARKGEQAAITVDLMSRQRLGKAATNGASDFLSHELKSGALDVVGTKGNITLRDAWKLAGLCVEAGASGCAFIGGFSAKMPGQFWTSLRAKESLGRGPAEYSGYSQRWAEKYTATST